MGSDAAALLNSTGHKLADRLSGADESEFELVQGLKVSGRASGVVSWLLFMTVLLCGGYVGVRVKNSMSRRAPVYLRETLMAEVPESATSEARVSSFVPPQEQSLMT